jgi:hypothetical protein
VELGDGGPQASSSPSFRRHRGSLSRLPVLSDGRQRAERVAHLESEWQGKYSKTLKKQTNKQTNKKQTNKNSKKIYSHF